MLLHSANDRDRMARRARLEFARHAGLRERGHAGVAGESRTQDQHRKCCARGFAEAHLQVKQRPEVEVLQECAMARFGGNVGSQCVIEAVRALKEAATIAEHEVMAPIEAVGRDLRGGKR